MQVNLVFTWQVLHQHSFVTEAQANSDIPNSNSADTNSLLLHICILDAKNSLKFFSWNVRFETNSQCVGPPQSTVFWKQFYYHVWSITMTKWILVEFDTYLPEKPLWEEKRKPTKNDLVNLWKIYWPFSQLILSFALQHIQFVCKAI